MSLATLKGAIFSRSSRYDIWNFFEKIIKNEVGKTKCKLCMVEYSFPIKCETRHLTNSNNYKKWHIKHYKYNHAITKIS